MNADARRPDPDALLAAIQKEEGRAQRGKLKIFLGMAAGVGKTYAMLEAARDQRAAGVQVAIGYVETHGRAEAEALVIGFEIIPRRRLEYRGTFLEEMDLDAVLACHPQLALVDELAHTNAPGARHPKRYQDVLELLDSGIDVYTTVNIQHLESRADTVQQITGAVIHETVPDSLIEKADSLELIDLAPDELRQRLAEGKVYIGEQRAEVAAQNFFRLGNLTALREMALRLTAERVDQQLRDYMQLKQIPGPWKSRERLMVAVSTSHLSERLVRWTRRMAYSLEAPWLAVYVETPRPLTDAMRARLSRTLALARELGGEVITTAGENIPAELLRVARQHNVTQIVIGKPLRSFWLDLIWDRFLVSRLIRESGNIDIYVVTGQEENARPADKRPWRPRLPALNAQFRSGPVDYLWAVAAVGVVAGISAIVSPIVDYHSVALLLLFAVSSLGLFVGRGPVLLAAALSALVWDFFFIPPRFTLAVSTLDDVLLMGMYFIIALVIGTLTSRLRRQARTIQSREVRTEALYALAREVASAVTMDDVLKAAVLQTEQVFDAQVAFLLPDENGQLAAQPHPVSTLPLTEKERSVAAWVFQNRKAAGRFTDTLPMAEARYLPLVSPHGVVGVMGVRWPGTARLSFEQEMLLETFARQVALAVERETLELAADQAALLARSEQLYKTLLNSVSHELRTPIAAITGAASSLLDPQTGANQDVRVALVEDIQGAGERLNRLVENLLDMSRLESGLLKPRLDWCDVSDLLSFVVNRAQPALAQHEVIVDVAADLPLVRMDYVLMGEALANLLGNAAVHTPPGTRVRLTARVEGQELLVVVADRGPGLPPEALPHVFDKFYRAPGAPAGGVGLGLSITRGLVEAQGGSIAAENRASGGARFTIRLPLHPPPSPPPEAP
jgi:two-component system sensor histidine kinase KdpD